MPSYEEAQKRPDWPKWEKVIQEELDNLKKTGTWHLVEWPPGANIVDCHWVLRIKKNAAGEIERGTKLDWWLRDSLKFTASTTMKPTHLSQDWHPFVSYWQ